MRRWRPIFLGLVVLATLGAIWSYVMITMPPQQTLDQKVQDVGSQLKCPVCQSESVADSPSLIAEQMRGVIRQQLQSGKSEQQVIDYFAARYGQSIVWEPQWHGFSMLAYLAPIGLLLGGGILLFFVLRDWSASSTDTSLSKSTGERKSEEDEESDLADYRQQLEAELAADDSLFAPYTQPQTQQTEAG